MTEHKHIARFFIWTDMPAHKPYDELTELQQQILVDIANTIARVGYPPSRNVIAAHVKVKLPVVHDALHELEVLRYIKVDTNSRMIRLIVRKEISKGTTES